MDDESPGEGLLRYLLGIIIAAILVSGAFTFIAYLDPALWDADAIYFFAAAAVFLGYLVARAFSSSIQHYLERYGRVQHAPAAKLFLDVIVATVVVAVLLHLLGLPLESIFFGSAFAGIVLGLAGQTVLANVFAGLLIVFAAPFRTGERIALLSTSVATIWPTYPRELSYSSLTGVIMDIGFFYTTLRLDSGRTARIPNSVVIQAMVINQPSKAPRSQRVRMTLAPSTAPAVLEAALQEYLASHPSIPNAPPAHVEVADIQPSSWDGVIVLWTINPSEEAVRDEVLRAVLPRLAPPTSKPARSRSKPSGGDAPSRDSPGDSAERPH